MRILLGWSVKIITGKEWVQRHKPGSLTWTRKTEIWVRLVEGCRVLWVSAGSSNLKNDSRGLKGKNWWGSACEFTLGRKAVLDDDIARCVSKGTDGWSEVQVKVCGGGAWGVRGDIHAGVGVTWEDVRIWGAIKDYEPCVRFANELTTGSDRMSLTEAGFKKKQKHWGAWQ